MKKIIIITAVLVIAAGGLFACGGRHNRGNSNGGYGGAHNNGCYTNGSLNHNGQNHYGANSGSYYGTPMPDSRNSVPAPRGRY